MLQKALDYLVKLKDAKTFDIKGDTYSTEQLYRIAPVLDHSPITKPIELTSLIGLCDYIKNGVDNLKCNLVVQVVSPTNVKVYSELRNDANRNHYINCTAITPNITFGSFMNVEAFNIMLQSCFLQTDSRQAVLKVIGNIAEENITTASDDGVTQSVVGKSGISTKANIVVPNPVTLCPFRTFVEIEQPESSFVFRLKEGFQAALYEADGAIWRLSAMKRIKAYLQESLEGCTVKIIS